MHDSEDHDHIRCIMANFLEKMEVNDAQVGVIYALSLSPLPPAMRMQIAVLCAMSLASDMGEVSFTRAGSGELEPFENLIEALKRILTDSIDTTVRLEARTRAARNN